MRATPAVSARRLMPSVTPPTSQVFFRSPNVGLLRFRCPVNDESWGRELTIPGYAISVSRTPVAYRLDSVEGETISTLNSAVLVNEGQRYRRRALSDRGLICETIAMDISVARDAIRPFDPGVDDRDENPFNVHYAATPARLFLSVRRLADRLAASGPQDPLETESELIELIQSLIEASYATAATRDTTPHNHRGATDRAHREIVEHVKTLIATRPTERWTLERLAREAHTSAFHLARIFKSRAGVSVHAYLRTLRVRLAAERIASTPRGNLAAVALDCGFASHSHLTRAFVEELGIRPSGLR